MYKYSPSFQNLNYSKARILSDKYEEDLKNFILTHKKSDNFFQAITDIDNYISGFYNHFININYDSAKKQDQILLAMIYRLNSFNTDFTKKIKSDIKDLSFNAISISLGLESYKKRNYKWNPYKYNIINHVIEITLKGLLMDYLKTEILKLDLLLIQYKEEDETIEESGEILLKNSNMDSILTNEIRLKILSFLNEGDNTHYKEIKPYLKLIYQNLP